MRNKVLVFDADAAAYSIESSINDYLNKGWLIELFYEARGVNKNKLIVTLYKEEN